MYCRVICSRQVTLAKLAPLALKEYSPVFVSQMSQRGASAVLFLAATQKRKDRYIGINPARVLYVMASLVVSILTSQVND